MEWLRITTKLGLLSGAGYVTYKANIWGDSKTTTEYVNKQCSSCDTLKYYKSLIPSCEDARIRWADSWNGGVRSVFSFIDQLPQHTVNGANWTYEKLQQLNSTDGTETKTGN